MKGKQVIQEVLCLQQPRYGLATEMHLTAHYKASSTDQKRIYVTSNLGLFRRPFAADLIQW